MSFEKVQREYDLSIDDVRAALKYPENWWSKSSIIRFQAEMRFLIDANMPRSTAELLKRYHHKAVRCS